MPYLFGQDITYNFYPINERDYVSLASVTTDPAIYVYKEGYKPSRTEAAAGTDNGGLVGTVITSWSTTTDSNGKYFTIPAIDDPDPTADTDRRTFWAAINFYLQNSEQKQTILRALPLERVAAHHKAVGVAVSDLEAVFPTIDSYVSSTNQTSAITTATTRCKVDLEAHNYEWAELWRPDRLATAITYKALSNLMFGLVQDAGDRWFELGKEYNAVYSSVLESLRLERIDAPDEDPEDNEKQPLGGFIRCLR